MPAYSFQLCNSDEQGSRACLHQLQHKGNQHINTKVISQTITTKVISQTINTHKPKKFAGHFPDGTQKYKFTFHFYALVSPFNVAPTYSTL